MIKAHPKLDHLLNNENQTAYVGYSLDSICTLLEKMGNPHRNLKTIHVAGTNGKGSTAYFLHKIFTCAGFRTGLYTSPHLQAINERVQIGDDLITDEELELCIDKIFSILAQDPNIKPTWFDVMTAIAFWYFHQKQVDYAIIEVGLGGRLDSTNVITPLVSIITNVDYDHMAVLGQTLEEISREKAGIVKKEIPVITAAGSVALQVIEKTACMLYAPLLVYGRDFTAHHHASTKNWETKFDYQFYGNDAFNVTSVIRDITIRSPLKEQIVNASLAITAAMVVCSNIDEEFIRIALRTCRIPGRLEVLAKKPLMIFDPAHNVAAVKAVCCYLNEAYPQKKKAVVLHCMVDKDVEGIMLSIQNSLTDNIFYIKKSDKRAFIPGNEHCSKLKIFDSEKDIIEMLKSYDEDVLILFTGSFRLYDFALRVATALDRNERWKYGNNE